MLQVKVTRIGVARVGGYEEVARGEDIWEREWDAHVVYLVDRKSVV